MNGAATTSTTDPEGVSEDLCRERRDKPVWRKE